MKKIIELIKENKVVAIVIAAIIVVVVWSLLNRNAKKKEVVVPETTVEVTAPAEVEAAPVVEIKAEAEK